MSDFKAKKAPNSMSAGTPTEIPLDSQLTPSPLSAHRASKQYLPPQICIPKSAYECN